MKATHENRDEQDRKLHLAGWLLFVVCAVLFITASLKNRDILTLIGSVFFLISCIVFIVPLVRGKSPARSVKSDE